MKVLVVGSGGREHPLVWKAAQSSLVSKLYAAPGNPGMAELVPITDVRELAEWAGRNAIELVIVGPEAPLVEGLADQLERSLSWG